VLPHDSLFTDRERPAKAAVVLKIRGGRMSDQVAGSIANLVSSAWDNLTPQNVTVITTDGQLPSSGHGQGGDGANGMADLETALAERVVQVLTPIVGADHVKSSVTIEYDPTSDDSTQDVYDPAASAVLTSQMSQENTENADPSGIPGTASNAPNTPPAENAAAQNDTEQTAQGMRSESKTFAVSHTTHHLIQPAGRIKRLAAAILVDDVVEAKDDSGKTTETRRKRTPEEMKSIEDLSKAALGWDSSRGDQISVQDVAFQAPLIEKPEPITLPNRVRVIAEQWTGLLRYAALLVLFLLVYFLLLNPVKRRVIATLESVEVRVSSGRAPALAGEAEPAGALPSKFGNEQALLEETSRTSPQFTQALALKQQIVTKVKTDPENASRLVQDWMRGSGVRS
jgi:flagellar M-ring protein FliF